MSQKTREEGMAQLRRRYARAGKIGKTKLIDQAVELFGYHRKSAIRALGRPAPGRAPAVRTGRPKTYDPEALLKPLKAIWLGALQPCGERLKAALPEWLPAYEEDHRRLEPDVREALLSVSRATLDRLLAPLRVEHQRRTRTRPGSLLRAQIPIHTHWSETAPGYVEIDTVALCGGSLDDRHGWMVDAVDVHTTWSVLRGLPNRSQASICGQMDDLQATLPFGLWGIDSDNGGEFINHQLVAYCANQDPPIAMTRSRAYHKNDQAHIEQKNYTNVRLWFGYERYDNAAVWPLINTLCRGPLEALINWYLPSMKLKSKERVGSRTVRKYTPTETPLARVLACAQVPEASKARLRAEKAESNPFSLRREVERRLKEIEAVREVKEP